MQDEVKHKAHGLLEYLLNNHHVNREPESILQAFKLSVVRQTHYTICQFD